MLPLDGRRVSFHGLCLLLDAVAPSCFPFLAVDRGSCFGHYHFGLLFFNFEVLVFYLLSFVLLSGETTAQFLPQDNLTTAQFRIDS